VLSIAAMNLDDGRLVAIQVGVRARIAERLSPVGRKPLHMLRMKAMAEGMTDDVVGHHATMPSPGESAEAVLATCSFVDSAHVSMMTIVPRPCNTMASIDLERPKSRMFPDAREGPASGNMSFRPTDSHPAAE